MSWTKTQAGIIAGLAALAVGCASGPLGEKGTGVKPVIDTGKGGLIEAGKADTAGGGTWREVSDSPVDTPHSYGNHENRSWTLSGSRSASRMKVVFERFELEAGYDFVTISDASGGQQTRHTGELTAHEVIVNGNEVKIQFSSDYSVTGWGARFRVYAEFACLCTADYNPVCATDGNTYGNACRAQCAGANVRYAGACRQSWFRVAHRVESAHPYTNNYDNTWTITEGGARRIRVHFSNLDVERGYDHVRIMDGDGRVIQSFSGTEGDLTSAVVEGSTIKIQLVSDYSITREGFQIDYYEVEGGCVADSDCAAGHRCEQVTCIRAPCFAVCAPIGGGIQDVALADLEANPRAYDGARIRVVAEPRALLARCTEMACSAENPCCNRCGSDFSIGQGGITLTNADRQPYGCAGNECTWRQECNPFIGSEHNGSYRMEGRFHITEEGRQELWLETWVANDCRRGGCSGQLCSNGGGGISTCEYRPEYACYREASCEPQRGGHCGWTQTPDLQSCIAGARNPSGFASQDTPMSVPDNDATGVTSAIEVNRLAPTNRVYLSLNIPHTYRGDLHVQVVAPDGTSRVLHDRAGGSADNLTFEDLDISQSFGGGRPVQGTWRLRVVDHAAWDLGTLQGWSLRFE